MATSRTDSTEMESALALACLDSIELLHEVVKAARNGSGATDRKSIDAARGLLSALLNSSHAESPTSGLTVGDPEPRNVDWRHVPLLMDSQPSAQPIHNIARFALPFDATAIVISGGQDQLLDLGVQRAWHFPQAPDGVYLGDELSSSLEAIEQLELLRIRGGQFLLLPHVAFWWRERFTGFFQYLDRLFELVVDDESCLIYYIGLRRDEYSRTSPFDNLPAPPPYLIKLVAGIYEFGNFHQSGHRDAQSIATILEHHQYSMERFESILDFGCGCGRTMRHWAVLDGPRLFGVDYNPLLIDWCRYNLTHAEFDLNWFASMLPYGSEKFDFVYSISIFTHIDIDTQKFWINELSRVLRPHGLLLITVHGTTRLEAMEAQERARFDAGEIVVRRSEWEGSNACATYHPEESIQRLLGAQLEVVEFVPGGMQGSNQDVILARKLA